IRVPTGTATPPAPVPPAATATVTPGQGAPGTTIEVTATGFTPGTQVNVFAGYSANNLTQVNTVVASTTGTVRITSQIPAGISIGTQVYFRFTSADGRITASPTPFRV